jgi:hypothetical protein
MSWKPTISVRQELNEKLFNNLDLLELTNKFDCKWSKKCKNGLKMSAKYCKTQKLRLYFLQKGFWCFACLFLKDGVKDAFAVKTTHLTHRFEGDILIFGVM